MRILGWTLLGIVIGLPSPQFITAQVRWEVTPQLGLHLRVTDVGATALASEGVHLRVGRIEPAVAFGLTAEFPIAEGRLNPFLRGLVTANSDIPASLECNPNAACVDIGFGTTDAQARIFSAGAGVVIRPFRLESPAQPFVALGVGINRVHTSVVGVSGDSSENAFGLHGTVGLDLEIAGAPFRIEVTDWWAAAGDPIMGTEGAGESPLRRAAQHDLSFTLGWRFGGF